MKNKDKNCIMCSDKRYQKLKLCKNCQKIKDFIREYGLKCIENFITDYLTKPSAPLPKY